MDRLPLTLHSSPLCHSPSLKDQLFYPNSSLQSVPSSWPPATYSMDLGDARSDPTTPDGQDGSFYSESGTLNGGASGSMAMDYFHTKTLSNDSSMEGASRTSFSDDSPQFPSMDALAARPHRNHPQHTTQQRLSDQQRHQPSSYAAHTQMQMNSHHGGGPPLAYSSHHPSLTAGAYGEYSLVQPQAQRAPSNFMRLSGGSNDGNQNQNQNQNQMHHRPSHPGNPALYHLAFNGIEIPPSPSPSPSTSASGGVGGGNWNLNVMHNNSQVYSHVQGGGVPVVLPLPPPPSASVYGPIMGIPSNLGALGLGLGQGSNLFSNVSIAQIQQYLGFRNAASLNNVAYGGGMNLSGGPANMAPHPHLQHGNNNGNMEASASASQLGLNVSGGGAQANTRPQSQSTMSTPSLAENSPTLPWSPSFDSASASASHCSGGGGGGSTVGSISYPAPVVVRGPPTPPQLVSDAMPPKPKVRPPPPSITTATKHRHHSSGANTSISSVRSSGQSQSQSQSISISVSPSGPIMPTSPDPTTSIPLRVRVNALPKDKRTMFERAAGELWNPRETEHHHHHHEEEGLPRSQTVFLEDLYALIASDQLRDQLEIPDDLVEPILKTILLPRADAQRGSRGGAAGHLCLWAGCGKTIKRLDHSRNHIREHCKSKPHTCGGQGSKGCGQTFLRMDDLKRHQKSHCSVLRSGPGRRPRSIRGTRRDTDEEEEERDSEDSTSLNGGDDDDYRPIHTRAHHHQPSVASASASSSSASTSVTRELASRLRSQRQRAARYVCEESTEESDPGNHHDHDHVVVVGRLHTSNVRRALESPVENSCAAGEDMESQKVWLAYSTLMASCSSQLITAPPSDAFFYLLLLPSPLCWEYFG